VINQRGQILEQGSLNEIAAKKGDIRMKLQKLIILKN